MFSLKLYGTGSCALGARFSSCGWRVASARPVSTRNAPSRATSVIEPPGTFGTPAFTAASTPSKMVP